METQTSAQKMKNDLRQSLRNMKKIQAEIEERLAVIKPLRKRLDSDKTTIAEVKLESNASPILNNLVGKILSKTSYPINRIKKELDADIKSSEKELQDIIVCQNLIRNINRCFENNNVKMPIDTIAGLLSICMTCESLTAHDIHQILGMAIHYNNYGKRKDEVRPHKVVQALGKYYNKDGSLIPNTDIQDFEYLWFVIAKEAQSIILVEIAGLPKALEISLFPSIFKDELISCNWAAEEEKAQKAKGQNQSIANEDIVSREDLNELYQYYKNSEIIAIPPNFVEFKTLMTRCRLDEKEQTLIMDLINRKLAEAQKDQTPYYLTDEQRKTYDESAAILERIRFTDDRYYEIVTLITELKEAVELLIASTDDEEKEYIKDEIEVIISRLEDINVAFNERERISTNNLLFLCDNDGTPYLAGDMQRVDNGIQKYFAHLKNKINKENQSNFRKILGGEDLEYTPYEVRNHEVHIFFVEIDAGIYVLVSGDIVNGSYKESIQRIRQNTAVLQQLEAAVKNPATRNQTLLEHEQHLHLLSKDPVGVARKRKN